jgi:RNA polymerase sigma factor (sigma-70 family)
VTASDHTDIGAAIDAVWRIESAKIIATLTRLTGDVATAEDLAQDALLAALERWPTAGIPDNPGAWLTATAKHRAFDMHRRTSMLAEKHAMLGREEDERAEALANALDDALDDEIGDELLRLIFICCHPVLPMESRVALTLRLLGGLTTPEIARAFLVPEPTIAQRIVRARRALADAHVPFEVPRGEDRTERIAAVLEVIYLIFNEGYAATSGDDWMRPALCDDALRLGRILAELAPNEPEVHGLVSLMELHSSRSAARTGASGEPVLLLDQNRARWDGLLMQRGLAALARAEALPGPHGPYVVQAEIVACHARARRSEDTDWIRIAALYEILLVLLPSPVVALNRAVAVGMAFGPAEGLALTDPLVDEKSMAKYHLLPSVRGDLLFRLGRMDEARAEFTRAASMSTNARERQLLERRAASCVT